MDILSSSEAIIRILIYLVMGVTLLIINIWYVRALREEVYGGEVVIAPFQVIGQKDDDGKLGSNLAYILQARLKRIEHDLAAAQESLKSAPRSTAPGIVLPSATPQGLLFQPGNLPIGLRSLHSPELLEVTDIKLAVGGVDVGGVVPWVQQKIVRPRTLNFSVIFEGDKAIIDGNIAAFSKGKGSSTLHIETKANSGDIASGIAYALIQRRLSEEGNSTVEALSLDDFGALLKTILSTYELNRKGGLGSPATKDDFAKLLPDIEGLAKKVPRWLELSYLAAGIAERAGSSEKALSFYEQIQNYGDEEKGGQHSIYVSIKDEVENKVRALRSAIGSADLSDREGDPKEVIQADVAYAMGLLNKWFNKQQSVPPVQWPDSSLGMISYWDGKNVNLPPQAQYLPDLTYHETAQSFISRLNQFIYQGESGAIQQSYVNILASLIKQERSGMKGPQADWVLVPGGIAWQKGEDVRTTKDRTPLISLKEPGSAYNDPVIGRDPQVSNYKDLAKGEQDAGGVHINVGIPNKAFYETAIRLNADRAREIWIKALPKLDKTAHIPSLAEQTYQAAGTDQERQALKDAWNKVGIKVGE